MKECVKKVDETKNCMVQVIKENDGNYKFYCPYSVNNPLPKKEKIERTSWIN